MNLQANAGKEITFAGTITDASTPAGTINIGGTTYTGSVNFNNTVTQKDMTISTGTVNISAGDLKITNAVLNNGVINLSGTEALTSAITGVGTTNIQDSFTTTKAITQGID